MSKKRLDLQMFADASAQLQNTTGAAGMTAEMKTYYEKTLLDLAEPALVHDQFGDKYPIPANNGKTIEISDALQVGKFDKVTAVTFAAIEKACIITDRLVNDKYIDATVVKEVLR